jgi:hypothetical protein
MSCVLRLIISLLPLICALCILIHGSSSRYTTDNAIADILVPSITPISLGIVGALNLRLRAVSTAMSDVATIIMLPLLVSMTWVLAVNVFRSFLEATTVASSGSSSSGRKGLRRWLSSSSRIREIRFASGSGDIVVTLSHIGGKGGRSWGEQGAAECTKVRIADGTTPRLLIPTKKEGNEESQEGQTNKSTRDSTNDNAGRYSRTSGRSSSGSARP